MSTGSRPGVRTRLAACAAVAALLWIALRGASPLLRRVRGASMTPTLRPGDLVLVVAARSQPRVGDVVIVRDPRRRVRETVKRVAATAGAWADLGGDVASVPAGHVAVRGDDPTASTDSRDYGPVPTADVLGRVVARVWPPPPRAL